MDNCTGYYSDCYLAGLTAFGKYCCCIKPPTDAEHLDDNPAGFPNANKSSGYSLLDEKQAISYTKKPISAEEAAASIVSALTNAEKPGSEVNEVIQDAVSQAGGWHERIGAAVYHALEKLLQEGSPLRGALAEAYDKAADAAETIFGFARDHPYYTAAICAIIVVGILVILAPSIIAALGFGELGPIEGRFDNGCNQSSTRGCN